MKTFRKPLAIACVGAAVLAALSVRSDSELRSGSPRAEHAATAECHSRSAACMVEFNDAYPAGDLSIVPPDAYF